MEGGRVPLILKNNGNCLFCQLPSESEDNLLRPLLHSLQIKEVDKVQPEHGVEGPPQLVKLNFEGFEIRTALCNGCGNLNQTFFDLKQKMEACLATIKAKVKGGNEKTDGIDFSSLEGVIMNEVLTKLNRKEPRVILQDLPRSEKSISDDWPHDDEAKDQMDEEVERTTDPNLTPILSEIECLTTALSPERKVGMVDNAHDCSTLVQSSDITSYFDEAMLGGMYDGVFEMEGVGEMIQDSNSSLVYSESIVLEEAHTTSKKGESSKAGKNKEGKVTRRCRRRVKGTPRGRMNAYAYFVKACGESLKKLYPDQPIEFFEFSKSCSLKWKSMSAQEKAPFQSASQADKLRFDAEMKTFVNQNGGKTGPKKMRRTDPYAPKRSLSAFVWFGNDMRPRLREVNPLCSFTDVSKEIGKMWAQIDPESRERYNLMAERDKQRYKREMEMYKATTKGLVAPQYDQEESEGESIILEYF